MGNAAPQGGRRLYFIKDVLKTTGGRELPAADVVGFGRYVNIVHFPFPAIADDMLPAATNSKNKIRSILIIGTQMWPSP